MDKFRIITAVIADDHTFFREGLAMVLNAHKHFKVVGEAANGADLITLAQKYEPDILIVDVAMPVLNGIEAVKKLIDLNLPSKVIALSMHTEDSIILHMLSAGAMGFLDKTTSKEELYKAIESVVINDRVYFPESTNGYMMKLLSNTTYKPYPLPILEFTQRELEVIEMVCNDFTTKEIGAKLDLSPRTIDAHRVRIMERMNVRSVAGMVAYAFSNGIIPVKKQSK
jgi:DNA-binding NarL/FixJ family response regulator